MKACFTGLRARLLALVLLAGLPALVVTFYTAAEQRRNAALDVQKNALRIARLASAGQERLIEGARQLLVIMSHLPSVRADDPAAANAMLSNLLEQYPLYLNFGVIEMDGSVFASGLPMAPDVNLSDRTYFTRAVETRAFAMGDYQIGRITHMPSVNFGYPILDEAGEVRRVAFAALDLSWLEQHAAEAELPEGGSLTVVDGAGTILARWPDPQRWRGKSLTKQPIWPTIARERQGTTQALGAEGDSLLFAFTQLRGAEGAGFVNVNIGIPTDVAFAEANEILQRNLVLLGVAGALALLAAWFGSDWFVLRRMHALLRATRRLEAGDLTARAGMRFGMGELGQLAHAFDAMADSLQQRGAERDRAETSLKQLNQELEQRVAERTLELQEKNEQLEADIVLAREFQIALLPTQRLQFPPEDGAATSATLRFFHTYQASGAVGGDFFDILPLSESQVGVAVCDVMGHGVRAALVTAIMRGLFEEFSALAHTPGEFVTEVNRVLVRLLGGAGTTMFVTACYAVIDLETRRITLTNAGHPWPLRVRRRTGEVESLQQGEARPGPALGLFEQARYRSVEGVLTEGDTLLLFTDGLYEVSGPDDEEFGSERLLKAINEHMEKPTETLLSEVVAEARGFSATRQFEDDLCVVAIDLRGANA